jgi:hypothetical protein
MMDPISTFGEPRRRRRRRFFLRLLRVLVVLALFVASLGYAYQIGLSQKAAEVERLRDDLSRMQMTGESMAGRSAQAMERAEQIARAMAELEARYHAEVPEGELRDILDLVRAKKAQGVPGERIAFVLGAVTRERECDPEVTTRRFLVQTPIGGGAAAVVAFADNRITVTGNGVSARNAQNQPEAWFDPAQPVELRFGLLGGASDTASGVLPLSHSLVVDGRAWRFTAKPGQQRGFLEITGQSCAYP